MATSANVWNGFTGVSPIIPIPPAPTPPPIPPSPTPSPPAPTPPPPTDLMAITQTFTATDSQTLFTLTDFTYLVGGNQLMIYVDGVFQNPGNYSETSSSSVTLGFSTLVAGDVVDIVKVA